MPNEDWKKQLIGYVNDSQKKPGSKYLTITNVSDETITLGAGEKLYLNMTPKEIREKYPKVPHFSKDVFVGEKKLDARVDASDKQLTQEPVDISDVPF